MASASSSKLGQPTRRIDGRLKVTGAAKYAAEYPAENLLHGYVVVSTIAVGRIVSIDTRDARTVPGVLEIITHNSYPGMSWWDRDWQDETAPPGHPFRPLHSDRILFDGQPIALVVAESFEAARDAAALVHVLYEVGEPNTDLRAASDAAYVPKQKRQGIQPPPKPRGDAEAAFAAAAMKVEAEYTQPSEHHNPIELFATTCVYDDGKLTIYDKTQGSQNSQAYVCGVFDLKPENVRVLNPFVGGAFGSGLRPRYQLFLAVMASLKLKRSVRVEVSRREMFYLSYRPITEQTVALGADPSGKLHSIQHDAVQGTSRFEDYQETVVNWSGLAYQADNTALTYELAQLDTDTPGDMRAPGAATGVFALETAMDELAVTTGVDPVELRKLNYTYRDEDNDKDFTSKALHACYREGAERFGWSERNPEPGSMRDGHQRIGYGMAGGFWEAQVVPAEATVRLNADGTAEIKAAATDIGTGTYTALALVAADELGLSVEAIDVEIGDSDLPTNSVQGGSRMAASAGTAVLLACRAIKERLLKQAQKTKGNMFAQAALEDTIFENGSIALKGDPGQSVALTELMSDGKAIEEGGKASPDKKVAQNYLGYTHSAVFVEVRVDDDLGMVRVVRVVSAIAAGRIMNPKAARSQILGGVVMGIGMALHEEGFFDHRTGRIMNHNLAEYHVPANADIEDIEVIFVDEKDDLINPMGVKGLGEIGIVGVAAAVGNAIYHATGKRLRDLPFTIDKIIA